MRLLGFTAVLLLLSGLPACGGDADVDAETTASEDSQEDPSKHKAFHAAGAIGQDGAAIIDAVEAHEQRQAEQTQRTDEAIEANK